MDWKITVVVVVITFVYVLIGGAVFQAIESSHETATRLGVAQAVANFLQANPCVSQAQMTNIASTLLGAYQNGVEFYGDNVSATNTNWNYYNSFFFCVTVVTTIGYGNVTPATYGGRSFCIFFAIFGIPLMLVALTGIGEQENRLITYARQNLFTCCHQCCSPRVQHVCAAIITTLVGLVLFIFIPAGIFVAIENGWTYQDGVYYCFVTLTTIGFGDFVAGKRESQKGTGVAIIYRLILCCWIVLGLAWVSSCIANFQEAYTNFMQKAEKEVEEVIEEAEEKLEGKKKETKEDPKDLTGMGNPKALKRPNSVNAIAEKFGKKSTKIHVVEQDAANIDDADMEAV